ncbi:MAG: hypothetical protein ACE5EL_03550 [Anaerolineae bacterium]
MRPSENSRLAFLGALVAAMALPVVVVQAGLRGGVALPMATASEHEARGAMMDAHPPADLSEAISMRPGAPNQADIARFVSQSWEDEGVFGRASAWRTFDPFVSQPSLNDEISWGRADCQSTVGSWSVWSVGGGSVGRAWTCGQDYPVPLPNRSGGIRTELQYLYLDFRVVPDVGGLRVTFDYKARMPSQALFVGAGDFDNKNPDGSIPLRGFNNFTADTRGDWVRGHRVEIRNGQDFQITGKERVLFAFVYADPPPDGNSAPASGMYGAFIDNVHLDALFSANPGIIPSPSAPPTASYTPTPTPTKTRKSVEFPTTPPPQIRSINLPVCYRGFDVKGPRTPIPTVPTATVTNTSPPPSKTPTATLPPSATPSATTIPTSTPIPFPEVLFDLILPLGNPEIARVKNFGTAPQDMTNWRVFEFKKTQNCYFPDGLILGPGETHEFQSGRKAEAGPGVTVCSADRLMWDNNLDEGQLWNHLNERVDRWCFDRYGPIPCSN